MAMRSWQLDWQRKKSSNMFQPKKLFHWQMSRACIKSHWFERQHHHNITIIVTIYLSQNQNCYYTVYTFLKTKTHMIHVWYRKKQSNVGKYTLIPWEIKKTSRQKIPQSNYSSFQGVKEFSCIAIIAIDATIAPELFKAQASVVKPPLRSPLQQPPSFQPPYQQELTRKRLSFSTAMI